MGTATGQVIDYLAQNLPAALTAVNPAATVIDGVPQTGSLSTAFAVIGATSEWVTDGGTGTRNFLEVGAGKINEVIDIPCWVYAEAAGPEASAARDLVIPLFDAVVSLIASDLTLGGVLLDGRIANVTTFKLTQVPGTGDFAGMVFAVIDFTVRFENHYQILQE